jgi:hypothetical protein
VLKKVLKNILIAIGIGAVLLFIWQVWGQEGNLAGFFGMLWDWFYTVCSSLATAVRTSLGW